MSELKKISRRYSLCSVMQIITNYGPISRASIARQTGLSKQTVSEIAQLLEKDGWIKETGRTKGHVGRTALTYEICTDAAFIASVDLGGTKVRVSICDLGCNILGETSEVTSPDGGLAVVRQIARLCKETALGFRIEFSKLALCVVGVPGVPDRNTGQILMAPNIKGIDEFDFATELSTVLDMNVQVENDVNLAVLGEHWAGCGTDIDDLAYIALGTGIGAGLMIEGQLVRGAMGSAGELGYLPFGADPFESASLEIGALERGVGSIGMCARYEALAGELVSVPEIFDLAAIGDANAVQTLYETARLLARTIATVCSTVNPSLVILGGSIGLRDELIDLVIPAVEACFPYPIKITKSELQEQAALIGGAAIGLTQLHHMLFAEGLQGVDITLPQPNLVLAMRSKK